MLSDREKRGSDPGGDVKIDDQNSEQDLHARAIMVWLQDSANKDHNSVDFIYYIYE